MCGVVDGMKRLICLWCTGVSPRSFLRLCGLVLKRIDAEGISNGRLNVVTNGEMAPEFENYRFVEHENYQE